MKIILLVIFAFTGVLCPIPVLADVAPKLPDEVVLVSSVSCTDRAIANYVQCNLYEPPDGSYRFRVHIVFDRNGEKKIIRIDWAQGSEIFVSVWSPDY